MHGEVGTAEGVGVSNEFTLLLQILTLLCLTPTHPYSPAQGGNNHFSPSLNPILHFPQYGSWLVQA